MSDPLSGVNTSMTSISTTLPTPAHSVNGSQLPDMSHDLGMGDDSPQKRKRAVEDVGDREQKKVHIEESKFGIDDLHMDVGEKYLLCKSRKDPFTVAWPLSPLPCLAAAPPLAACG